MAAYSARVLSLCSGIGGLDAGVKIATSGSARTVCYVEGEAFAAACLVARMQDKSLDSAPIWSDIKTFDAKPWRGKVDCIIGGYPCFTAAMLVLTAEGYRPISSLSIGDQVLTHRGRWKQITSIMRKTGAALRVIRGQGTTSIVTTDEHPFYVRTTCRRDGRRHWSEPRWVTAQELRHADFVGQVLPPVVSRSGDDNFWWLVGRYLADGWRFARPARIRKDGRKMRSTSGRVIICANKNEAQSLAERIAACGFSAWRENGRTVDKFIITNGPFFRFLGPFGKYAHGKTLPSSALCLDRSKAKSLLDGYISGDGYSDKNGNMHVTTVSESLALGVSLLAQRAYGVVCSIKKSVPKRQCKIEGRIVRERPQYRVTVPNRNRSGHIDGNYGWKRVRVNEQSATGDVYNIAVDEDESYCVNGAIVHNCQPFSVAGKRQAEKDPRHLWPFICKIVATIRPAVLFCENVPGHVAMGFEQVCKDLSRLGYEIQAGIFSAEECGAPHRRERLFFFAYADSYGLRQQYRGRGRQDGQIAPITRDYGGKKHVADADNAFGRQPCTGGQSMGGQNDRIYAKGEKSQRSASFSCSSVPSRLSQSGLGDSANGPPDMVGHIARGWGADWEAGVSRVTDKKENRVDRLRALGNAVVPATAALAWSALLGQALGEAGLK